MEKRAFLAVVLSIVVFYLFSMVMGPDKKQVAPASPNTTVPVNASAVQPGIAPLTTSALQPVPVSGLQKNVTVETDLYTAVFSSRGGALKSMTLKKFREQNSPSSSLVVLGSNADPALLNFSTRANGFNLSDSANYTADVESVTISGRETHQLVFTHVSGQGFTVKKIYGFGADSYTVTLATQVLNNSAAAMVGSIQHVMTYPAEPKVKDNRFDTAGSYILSDNTLQVDKAKDVASASKKYDKDVQWSGFADKFFFSALLAEKSSIASVELKKNASGFMESIVSSPQVTINAGQSVTVPYRLFVGPKGINILKAQGNSLEKALDLGWFKVIAMPLLDTLNFFYRYVGNYGVAIIIITIILKALFFPLTHKSYKSMKDMQKIQPKMAALKEKFKDDRDAMNKAVMELYREHKVNPMGGCLPMVVQIPVFFALYKALSFSIELRHAPFFLWVTDLADKDPYYVTPVIMGITMFVQQKMTPSQMDPIQQKMMLALPVVFTFMFLSFPSGLVLYWLVNNILTIGQQMYINKLVKD
jgi:YidC/Oxa1 family membrane protein insertase